MRKIGVNSLAGISSNFYLRKIHISDPLKAITTLSDEHIFFPCETETPVDDNKSTAWKNNIFRMCEGHLRVVGVLIDECGRLINLVRY